MTESGWQLPGSPANGQGTCQGDLGLRARGLGLRAERAEDLGLKASRAWRWAGVCAPLFRL